MGLAFEIEDMAHEAENLRSLTLAVYDAIYNGCTAYEEFDNALYTVFCLAHEHMEHLEALTEKAYALIKNGGIKNG